MAGLIFEPLAIGGVVLIRTAAVPDERGSFGRTFDAEIFAAHGLPAAIPQENVSRNRLAGTLRGLHGTVARHPEAKYVTCTAGRIFDVVVDARRDSPGFGTWLGLELDASRDEQLFVPAGCLHGFQTLEDESVVRYRMSLPFDAEAFEGRDHASPALGIRWPLPVAAISGRDAALPPFA